MDNRLKMGSPVKNYSNKSFIISSPPYSAFGPKVNSIISFSKNSCYDYINVSILFSSVLLH